jgi:hypothetical protein
MRVFEATEAEMVWTNPFPGDVVPAGETLGGVLDAEQPQRGAYHVDFGTGEQAPFVLTAGAVRIDNVSERSCALVLVTSACVLVVIATVVIGMCS